MRNQDQHYKQDRQSENDDFLGDGGFRLFAKDFSVVKVELLAFLVGFFLQYWLLWVLELVA